MAATGQRVTILQSRRCVLGGVGGSPLRVEPARLIVRGSQITELHPLDAEGRKSLDPPTGPGEIVDLGDRLLSPAFINGHTHLSMAAFRGIGGVEALGGNVIEDLYYRLEAALEPEAIRAFTRIGAYESLLCGVGLVWDHYYGGEAVAEALRDVGLAGVVAPTLQDLKGPGVDQWDKQLEATLEIDRASGPAESPAPVAAALGPHATDTVSARGWARIAELAREHALPIHVHVAQSHLEFERALAVHSCSPLRLLHRLEVLRGDIRALLVHAIFLDRDDLQLVHPEMHVLGYCPFSQLQFCFPADAPAWAQRGLPWLVATDCAASNDSMNVQKELRLVAGLRGFSTSESDQRRRFQESGGRAAAEALERLRAQNFAQHRRLADPSFLLSRVWSVPGDLHPRLLAGVLEPGRLANMIVWNTDHPSFWPADDPLRALAMNDTAGAIDGMMVAGEWIGRRGDFHRSLCDGDGYREALREAEHHLRKHLRRLGMSDGTLSDWVRDRMEP